MRNTIVVSEQEFLTVAQEEVCLADLGERNQAVLPVYLRFNVSAQDLIAGKTFPPWRTNKAATQYVGAYEVSSDQAFPISFVEFAKNHALFGGVKFETDREYFATKRIITFRCNCCGVRVVKDGNHRLLQCAVHKLNPELEVYEVASHDWSASKTDMKNLCERMGGVPVVEGCPEQAT